MFVQIDGNSLTYEQIHQVIYEGYSVKISDHALENIKRSRALVEDSITNNKVIYGVNTGFGKFSDTVISKDDLADLQINLIRSHACGLGEPFPIEVSQVMLLLRANALAKGYSGIRLETLQLLIDCLNQNIVPVIPSQGSLGASGDLAPLSHLALLLVGEGEAVFNGKKMSGAEALKLAGLQPIKLQAKEGLALINGTQAMTAVGVVAYMEAQKLADLSDGIASLTLEGLQGIVDAFTPESHSVRPYPEQKQVAERILSYLDGSQLTTTQGQIRVQDAYSLRCIPQVHGAIQQVLNYVKEKLSIEINSATDNPLIFSDSGNVISGGNFHGQPIAFAMDFLGIAMSEVGNISERRIERLVNPQLSDLPAFLSPDPGLQSGLMITQYAAASLVSENKTLAHPSSVDSIPSSANQEDHVSMGTTAARHAYQIIQNSRRVLAIEAICAAQAADIRGVSKLAPETTKLYSRIRKSVPTITKDRIFSRDIEKLAADLKGVVKEVNYEMVR
ncbi:histidine ammonia-lyase [Priestia megaterium]|uniref:histidine ammonia-lyase n=1 Tax=Priestia megaterium TaxID=1404 RepID=UPI0018673893|nr:histidine ammonia-lyase [Priestia megaterium]MBE2978538.1 histidine ammonia-lyase [Priestia megaterium]MBT2258766.1 histidine ammonia-lyase [Priestia megaterium]MBT2281752.1 histidine ammonia-lyase [Priestia megaterium]